MVVGGFHHLELHLVFFLQRHRAERRDAQERWNVCLRGGCAVALRVVEDAAVGFGGRHLETCSYDHLLSYRLKRGHAIGNLRDQTVGSGWRWRARVCRQRRRPTAHRRLWRRRRRDRRRHLHLAAAVVVLIWLVMHYVLRLRRRWVRAVVLLLLLLLRYYLLHAARYVWR